MKVMELGRVLFRYRSYTPVPILALILFFLYRSRGYPGPGGDEIDRALNWVGLVVALLGEGLRFYTLGLVPDGTSGQGSNLEAITLNTQGPYARVRNPLYLGNLGICLGLLMVAHNLSAYALGLIFFFGEYFFIIRAEERFLEQRFGDAYRDYRTRVPRWIPLLRPAYPGRLRPSFDWQRAFKKEHNPFAAWASAAIVLLGWEWAARGTLGASRVMILALLEVAVLATFLGIKAYKHGHFLKRSVS